MPLGPFGLDPAVLLPPTVVLRLNHLDHATDVGDRLPLGNLLVGSFELADDLLAYVTDTFHRRVPGPVRSDEESHSL